MADYTDWLHDANNRAQNDQIAQLEYEVQKLQIELNSTPQALKELIEHIQFPQQLNGQGRTIQLDEITKALNQPVTEADFHADAEARERAVKDDAKLDSGQW